jgi:ABC-type multidrug transport system ATPase subunit
MTTTRVGLALHRSGAAAVDGIDLDLDLDLRRGEVLAFLEPNGVGQSTTIKILEG